MRIWLSVTNFSQITRPNFSFSETRLNQMFHQVLTKANSYCSRSSFSTSNLRRISVMHSSRNAVFFLKSLFWSPSHTFIFVALFASPPLTIPNPQSEFFVSFASILACTVSRRGYLFLQCDSIKESGNTDLMHSMTVSRSCPPPSQFLHWCCRVSSQLLDTNTS